MPEYWRHFRGYSLISPNFRGRTMIGSVLYSGFSSIQAGMKLMDSSARAIAQQAVTASDGEGQAAGKQSPGASQLISPTGDVTRALLEQRQALYQVQAGAKLIQTSDDALGSLLDALA